MRNWLRTLHDELQGGWAVVRVVVATVRGSAPREPGACMLVSPPPDGDRTLGTIGGGHLELVATRIAHDMLEGPSAPTRCDRFSLGASLGQCCGGIVELWFERYDAADLPFVAQALAAQASGGADVIAGRRLLSLDEALREAAALDVRDALLLQTASGPVLYERITPRNTPLWLFGAGHVGKALVHVLAPLPFDITWVDSREAMLRGELPDNVRAAFSPDPADEIGEMAQGAWALVMTHSHDEDFAICQALLEHGRFGWAGVIGSAPKAMRFRQRLRQRGFSAEAISRLTMPIGIEGIRSKEAAAIAVGVAAQLLQLREIRAASEVAADHQSTTAARRS